MGTFNTQIIRIAADTTSKENVLDINTSAEPQAWWARDLMLEVGVFASETLLDVSDLQSVTLSLKDPSNLDGAALVSKTVTVFDNTTTGATWAAGTQQHFTVSLGADDLSFTLTNASRLVRLVVTAITTGGKTGTICVGTLNVIDDGGNSPTDNPANAITVSQAQAMVASLSWAAARVALSATGTTTLGNSQSWLAGRQPIAVAAGTGAYVVNILLNGANALAGALLRVPIDFAASVNPTINIYDVSPSGTLLQTITQIDGAAARSYLGTYGYDGSHWHKESGAWVL